MHQLQMPLPHWHWANQELHIKKQMSAHEVRVLDDDNHSTAPVQGNADQLQMRSHGHFRPQKCFILALIGKTEIYAKGSDEYDSMMALQNVIFCFFKRAFSHDDSILRNTQGETHQHCYAPRVEEHFSGLINFISAV
ncbi:hypothetical protein Tco_0601295 [Tanacetum coccineum]